MTLEYFFSKSYLFDPTPSPQSGFNISLLIFFSILIFVALLIKISKNIDQKIKDRQFYSYLICGILGLFYLMGRYESLPGLGSRFTLLLILSLLIVWTVINSIWMVKYIPKVKQQEEIKEHFIKYLPKTKKKRKK